MKTSNTSEKALDFFGSQIHVGSRVAFMHVGYRTLTLGKVTKLTEKMVFMEYTYQGRKQETKQEHHQVIVKPQ